MTKLPKILPPPTKQIPGLPTHAKWLAGEGAGSWFVIEPTEYPRQYYATRLSPEGVIECQGLFIASKEIDLEAAYSIAYPAHCLKISLLQENEKISLISLPTK